MKWDKQVAVDAIRAYYDSIELTAWAKNPTDAVKRYWRSAQCKKGRVYAFVDYAKLMRAVDAIYEHSFVVANFVRKTIEDRIGNNCITQFVDGGADLEVFIDDLIASFVRAPRKPINVYMAVYGTVVTKRFRIGQYEFIPGDQFDTLNLASLPVALRESVKKQLWENRPHVCVTVEACDGAKAKELAYPIFQWLENAVRLFLDDKVCDFGVTTFDFRRAEHSLAISQDGSFASFNSQLRGCIKAFDLVEKLNDCKALWLVLENLGKSPTELNSFRQGMRQAVYLAGLSKKESNIAVAYFLCISAMERLFARQGDPYVNPSIAQQIVEAFCLLLASDEHRRRLFDDFQDAYKKRSAVAHGAAEAISEEELLGAQHVLRDAVAKLLIDSELSKITDLKQVQNIIKDIKFGKRVSEVGEETNSTRNTASPKPSRSSSNP